jgi:TonB family protein
VTRLVLSLETHHIDEHTRRATGVSFLVHAFLLAWLVLQTHLSPGLPVVTEISWLDPGSLAPGLPQGEPVAARGPEVSAKPEVGLPAPASREEHFERREPDAEQALKESPRAIQDRLSERLASLQSGTHSERARAAAVYAPTPVSGTLTGAHDVTRAAPVELTRGGGGGGVPGGTGSGGSGGNGSGSSGRGVPLPLLRAGQGGIGMPAAPVLATPKLHQESESSRPSDVDRSHVRNLAGASLMGPVADRPLVSSGVPTFPEWAKREGVEATVSLYFIVTPDGHIKENILVEKTSGFEDFDSNAIDALRSWRFEPLGPGTTGEQWGTITFHFRLRNAG